MDSRLKIAGMTTWRRIEALSATLPWAARCVTEERSRPTYDWRSAWLMALTRSSSSRNPGGRSSRMGVCGRRSGRWLR